MRRAGLVWFVVLVSLFMGGAAQGQNRPTYCSTLSRADCAILEESAGVMDVIQSTAFHLDFSLELTSLAGLSDAYHFRLVGDGSYAVAGAAWLENVRKSGTMALAMERLLKGISSRGTFILELPESWTDPSLSGSALARLPFEYRLVEGYGYLNLDKIAALDSTDSLEGGWYGVDLAGFYRALFEQQPGFFGQENPFSATVPVTGLYELTTIKRLEDTEIRDQTMAVFKTALDVQQYFQSSFRRTFVRLMLADTFRSSAPGLWPEDTDWNAVAENYIRLIEGFYFEGTQSIGQDDKRLHRITIRFGWQPDADVLAALRSGADPLGLGELGIDLAFDGTLDLYQFDAVPAVQEPDDATIFPLDTLIPLMPIPPGGAT